MSSLLPSRIRVRRSPKRARYDRESVYRVLDREPVAHIGFVDQGQPYCIPTLCARVEDRVLVHGSSASRMIRVLAAGTPACLTVTVLDGLVLARSAFEHSANYDSVLLLGRFTSVAGDEKLEALRAFVDVLIPGRWSEVRPPTRQELNGTMILALAISEASVKTRAGPPDDDQSYDAALDVWAGVLPRARGWGQPRSSPGLRPGIEHPESVRRLLATQTCPSARTLYRSASETSQPEDSPR